MGRAWLIILAAAALPVSVVAQCRVTEAAFQDYKALVLENEYLSVTVVPDSSGRIAGFVYKPLDVNHMAPLRITRTELYPGAGVHMIAESNAGGHEDWTWGGGPIGVPNGETRYRAEIVQNTRQRVCLAVTRRSAHYTVERRMTLAAGSALLDVEVRLANPTDKPFPACYWGHTVVQPGGYLDFKAGTQWQFTPVRRTLKKIQSRSALFEADGIFAAPIAAGSRYLPPRQGWWAIVDRRRAANFGQIFDVNALMPDGLLYTWAQHSGEPGKPDALSQEMIFPSVTIEPGGVVTQRFAWVAFAGLRSLHYLSRDLGVEVAGGGEEARFAPREPIVLRLISPTRQSGWTLKAGLVATGCTFTLPEVSLSALSPDTPVPSVYPWPEEGLPAGEYRLRLEARDSQGTLMLETELLGPRILAVPSTTRIDR